MDAGRRLRAWFVLVVAISWIAYAPALTGDFLLDDHSNILENPLLLQPAQWPRFFYDASAYHTIPSLARLVFRPLAGLCFGAITMAGGLNPFWFHLAGVSLHALNAGLLFLLLRGLLGSGLPAVAGALLFSLHPAQAESAAYISAFSTPLSTAFCLAALLVWGRPGRWAGWGASAWLAAGLLSKESAVFLAAFLPVYDLALRPEEGWRARLVRWGPPAGTVLLYVLWRHLVLGATAQAGPWGAGADQMQMALLGLGQDLKIAFWPEDLRVCYSFPAQGGFSTRTSATALLLVLLTAAAVQGVRRRRLDGLGLAWFLLALAPVANIVPLAGFAADRFLYLPLAGLGLVLGAWMRGWSRAASALVLSLLALLGLSSAGQQLVWQSEFQVDSAAHAACGGRDPCGAIFLASHYYNWNMLSRAEAMYLSALEAPLNLVERQTVLRMLGLIGLKRGDRAAAARFFDAAIALGPDEESAGLRRLALSAPLSRAR